MTRRGLTALSIENMKPAAVRREVPDGKSRGLYLVIQPSGRKSFALRYRRPDSGKPAKLTLGNGNMSLATARKAAADAMAYELGVQSVEGLIRNRYVGRTFIEGTNNRADRARLKYTPLREVLAGKRVLLIEDTIVRCTTLRSLLNEVRERGGAREVHVRVACPPIMAPCFYGIDMSTVRELFAPRFMKDERPTDEEQQAMAKEIGADSLLYLPLEAIARCIGLEPDRLCRACLTGKYPTPTGNQLYQLALRTRNAETNGRTYELPAASGVTTVTS